MEERFLLPYAPAGTSAGESVFLIWHQDQMSASPTQSHGEACTSLPAGSQMRCLQHLARSHACPPAGGPGRLVTPLLSGPPHSHFSGLDCPVHCRAWSWSDAPEVLHQSLPAHSSLWSCPAPEAGPSSSLDAAGPAWVHHPLTFMGDRVLCLGLPWSQHPTHLLASQLGPPSSRTETKAP